MAVLEEGLLTYLQAYAGLTALISTRVYLRTVPQGVTYPCLTFQRISTPRVKTMDSSGATGDLASPRFQFDAWATTDLAAKAITDQVRAALNGKQGAVGAVTIRAALVDGEQPIFEPKENLSRNHSEYIIWQEE